VSAIPHWTPNREALHHSVSESWGGGEVAPGVVTDVVLGRKYD